MQSDTVTDSSTPEEICYWNCGSGAVCNAVLRPSNPEIEMSGASAKLLVTNPQLYSYTSLKSRWSASRVAISREVSGQQTYIETGWMKWVCFQDPSCNNGYYGSWKNSHRHIVVRLNANGSYGLWDMANTWIGNNQTYRVENLWIGDPWNVWGWAAYVNDTKFLQTWTGFRWGVDPWYGAERETRSLVQTCKSFR